MTEAMEKELGAALDTEVKRTVAPPEPVPLRAAAAASLSDQIRQLERAEAHIADRLRKAGIDAQCDTEKKIAEANADFTRRLSDETMRLTRERDDTIRHITDEYHNKLHELATLFRRRP